MTKPVTSDSCRRPPTLHGYPGAHPTPFNICDSCDSSPAAMDDDAPFPEPAPQTEAGAWSR